MAGATRSPWLTLLAIALVYISVGVSFGFLDGGVAPILRSQGMDIASLRWVYALYLPIGASFLWAPLLDLWRFPWLGRRTGWIVPMQWVAVLAVAAVAFIPPQPGAWGGILLLGILASLASATMDVALDALTVEVMPRAQRSFAAAAKVGGVSVGALIGGGLLVAFFPHLGWRTTLLIIAAIMALSALPIIALVAADRQTSSTALRQSVQITRVLRRSMRGRVIRLTLLLVTLPVLYSFGRLALVDLGMSLQHLGSLMGVISPLVNSAACLLGPLLLRTLPTSRAAALAAIACLLGGTAIWLGCVLHQPGLALVGCLTTSACASVMYVVLGEVILGWASGSQAATDYSLFYGSGRLMATMALLLLPGLIQRVGWSFFQGAALIAFALAAWYFWRLLASQEDRGLQP